MTITTSNNIITFNKPRWFQEEAQIASCLGFKMNGNGYTADMKRTSKAAVFAFMRYAYSNLIKSPQMASERARVYKELGDGYESAYAKANEAVSALPFSDKLYEHQKECIAQMLLIKHTLLAMEQGLGKDQPLDADLITPTGVIKMGDVKIGNQVVGSDGNPCEVQGVYPQGENDVYEVVFSDGSKAECSKTHLWIVDTHATTYGNSPPFILELKDIMNDLHSRPGRYKYSIPWTKPVYMEQQDTVLDPYLMGLLLGDGCFRRTISFSTSDLDLIPIMRELLPDMIIKKQKGGNYSWNIINGSGNHYRNLLTNKIKSLGLYDKLSHEKFIPDSFKFNSIENRIAILQGLLDTDGHIHPKGNRITFSTVSRQLMKDVRFLVESLGGSCRASIDSREGRRDCYYMMIVLGNDITPFRLKRRLDRLKPKQRFKQRSIVAVNYIGKKETQCIKVNSPDHSYLTNNFIVTHNTITAISVSEIMAKHIDNYTTIIICPASCKYNWLNELVMWGVDESTVSIYDSKKKNTIIQSNEKYAIINYDMLRRYSRSLATKGYNHIILDEATAIKNIRSKRHEYVERIVNAGHPKISLLSGTPIWNRVEDLFGYLKLTRHPLGLNYKSFINRYTESYLNNWGYQTIVKGQNLFELSAKISNLMIRRRKEDCLDLPEKIYTKYYFEFDQYSKEYEAYIKKLEKSPGDTQAATSIHTLNRLATKSKIKNIIEAVENILDTGEKIVLFTSYSEPRQMLEDHFEDRAVCIHGGVPTGDRQVLIDRFTNDEDCKVFIGNMQAAGTGINLQVAHNVLFCNFPLTFSELGQCIDRSHRIGLTDNLNVYYTICNGSIDESIYEMIVKKAHDIKAVLDGGKETVELENVTNQLLITNAIGRWGGEKKVA